MTISMGSVPPPGPLNYTGDVTVQYINRTFDPETTFNKFAVPTLWVNTSSKEAFILVNKEQGVAFWLPIGGAGTVKSVTGDDGTVVLPDADGNINILGLTVPNATNPQPVWTNSLLANEETVEVQVAAAVAPTPGNSNDAGLCSLNSNQFTVTANGFVSMKGSTTDGPILTVTGDDATAVTADGSGNIDLLGLTVPNATNAQPVYIASLAPNSETVQVQLAAAVAPTPGTAASAGLACFNNTQFTVDATSGMVSSINSGSLSTLTGDTGPAAVQTAGNINLVGGGAATGIETTSSGSQVAFNVFRWVQPTINNWTPILIGKTAAGVGTYTKQHGVYARIGNVVFFTFQLEWTAHTGTGDMRVTGLPYIFAKANTIYVSPMLCQNILMPANYVDVVFSGINSQTYGDVVATIDNAARSGVAIVNAGTIVTYGFYFTDS